MMNPVPWLQMTNMISYQGLVRTFPNDTNAPDINNDFYEIAAGGPLIDGKWEGSGVAVKDSKVYNNLKYTITVTQVD